MNTDSQTKPAGRGCLFYGCLSFVALAIVVLVTGYLTFRYVVNTAIENYTDSEPQVFEAVVISEEDRKDLLARYAEFKDAKGKTNQPVELVLTSNDINALIAEDDDKQEITDHVRIDIEGDELNARASIPLEPFSSFPFLGGLKDRHLNISFNVALALENGRAKIDIMSGEVNGQPVPAEILEALKSDQSFKKALNDPDLQKQIDKLNWIQIEDGKLRIGVGGSEPPSD